MVHELEIIYSLILLQAILRCLYFWQLKEYRWDRFREWLTTRDARQYFLPTLRFFHPKPTVKIFLLGYLSFYFSVAIINSVSDQILAPIMAYFLVPVTAATAVGIIAPISELILQLIVMVARLKLRWWHPKLRVVGITGSYGKTSTKEILAHLLAEKFVVYKTPQTVNTLIGVAGTVLKMPRSTQVFVAEIGAYRLGEISAICRLIRPQIGILTGINQQHLGLFGSQQNIVAAKSELLASLPKTGLAVVNGLSPFARQAARASRATVEFYVISRLSTNLNGKHQQLNLAAALAAAKALQVKPKSTRLMTIPSFKTAITQAIGLNQSTIILDNYNSNSDGFLAAIEYAKSVTAKHKILISPGIIELGSESESVHQQLISAANKVFDEVIMTKREQISEAKLLARLSRTLTKNHLLLIEGRFSVKFIKTLCQNRS